MSETREKRDRKFTPKGQTMFDDQSNELREKCEKIWSKIEDLMIIVPSSNTLETLRQLNTDIDSRYKNFCRRSEEYKSFITRADTNESQQLISDYNEYFVTCVSTYRKVNSEIKKKKADLVEQLSQVSSSNGSSKASSKRAKAEAEKVRLEFVRKEGELMKQKAAIEADINIVKQESKVAAAETEVRILEQGDQEQDIISEVCEKKDDISNYVHNVHFQEPVASWLNQQPNIPVVASSASQAFSAAVSVPQIPNMCEIRNDPAFSYNSVNSTTNSKQRPSVISRRLDVSSESSVRCPLHKAGHTLNDCRGFRKYPIQDRQKFLREKRICFKCCETNEHFASNCTVNVKCAVCGNKRHATAMHIDRYTQNRTQADNEKPLTADGGEHSEDNVTV
ncbi:Hypothetical predicted protein [Mytilus galloprovincialis]|uniref:CCHC-type domain-containing protein n=1 Tax=Mytilus galloprovincialis TaxID=29158 RepID=A0A8B6GK19_MYTGA|nr:Hypothetical predicted protein [Mytilus galloprovincialis]